MRGRRVLSIPLLVFVLVVSLLPGSGLVHAATAKAGCTSNVVIGVRGSGQAVNDPADPANVDYFGKTLEPYRKVADRVIQENIYSDGVDWVPLLYPAVPAYSQPSVYEASVETGTRMLVQEVKDQVARCASKIGLMGYSQGAQVVNRALRRMGETYRGWVDSVLLLADPTSAGAPPEYTRWAKADGQWGVRDGYGFFGSKVLPADIWVETTDFCIIGDPVCDAKTTGTFWDVVMLALSVPIHLMYEVCCGVNNFVENLGTEFAYRLFVTPQGQGRPPPPEPVDPYVHSLAGLPDGQVLLTEDTERVYKLVGGAPVWLSSCANNICAGIRPTSQAVINTGSPVPRDGATAKDEAGNVFKFVGGAPIHLSSCTVGCGSPVAITAWSIVNREHMRGFPADGATAKDEAGNIFKFVGGAPIHLSSCSVGCGNPVPITGWSVANLEHMRPFPADASTAVDEAGNIFKFAGGAPIHLASCTVGCGNPVPITGWSVATLEHMRPVPADGTVIVSEPGDVFVFAGGAPLHLSSCVFGCESMIRISGASIINLDHMRPFPADNTTIRTESGAIYKFAGGAPLHLKNCDAGCGTWVNVTQWTVDNREHMNRAPAPGTYLRAVETGALFLSQQGQAVPVGRCPMTGCANAVAVNAGSIAEATGAVQTAFHANSGNLYLHTQSGGNATGLGMAAGTSPACAALAGDGYVTAFRANTGNLWVSTPAGNTDTKLGVMAGTSPAVAALPGGGYVAAFQANTGNLWVFTNGGGTDTKIGMKAGTSPAIAAGLDGGYQIAVHANTGNLWTVTTGGTNTNIGMMPGTSPAITALAGGGYAVAVQANTGRLWVLANGTGTDTQLGMMAGTSPAIAAGLEGGHRVAFHASTGNLWELPSSGGGTNTNLGMQPGTSPSITPAPGGNGYTVAFHANTGNLWLHTPAGGTNTQLGMLPGTSPAAGTSLTWR